MFWPDTAFQQRFYRSRMGKMACRRIRALMRARWMDAADNSTIIGIGYTTPYLQHWCDRSAHVAALMPAPMGVYHWPKTGHNHSLVIDPDLLPLDDQSVDYIIMTHMLEHTQQPALLIEEASRILRPGGRLLMVAPNRSGLWSKAEDTPFGYGAPYSRGQIASLMEQAKLSVIESDYMLYCPPTNKKLPIRYARWLETFGKAFLPICGGLVWMDAQKQLFAPIKAKRKSSESLATGRMAWSGSSMRKHP